MSYASPAVVDGGVYVNANDGNGSRLHVFDVTTGALRCSWALEFSVYRFPPTVANGIVYVTGDRLSAFDVATGAVLWSAGIGLDTGHGSPANRERCGVRQR